MEWLILYQTELDVPQDITLLRGHAPLAECVGIIRKKESEKEVNQMPKSKNMGH